MVLDINNQPSIEPEQLENFIVEGFNLIDVREEDEWNAGQHQIA